MTDRQRHRLCLLLMLIGAALIVSLVNAPAWFRQTNERMPRYEASQPDLPGWPSHAVKGLAG